MTPELWEFIRGGALAGAAFGGALGIGGSILLIAYTICQKWWTK